MYEGLLGKVDEGRRIGWDGNLVFVLAVWIAVLIAFIIDFIHVVIVIMMILLSLRWWLRCLSLSSSSLSSSWPLSPFYYYLDRHRYNYNIFFTIKPKMKQMDVSKWNKNSYSIIQPVSNKDFTSTNSKPPTQTKERKPYLIYMSLSWITSTRYLGITAVKRWRDISSEIRGRRDARWRVIGGNGRTFGGNGVPLGKSFWFVNGVCVLLSFSFLFGVYVFFSKRR